MPSPAFTARLDTTQQQRFLKRYTELNVTKELDVAAKAGADAAKKVLVANAPVGTSEHPSQYYRKMSLPHGTFRRSIRAAKIRGRRSALKGLQGATVGYVVGPMGKNAFTRYWREQGTNGPGRHRVAGLHWTEHSAGMALSVARSASESKLAAYAKSAV